MEYLYSDEQRLTEKEAQSEADVLQDCIQKKYAEDYESAHSKILRMIEAKWATGFSDAMNDMHDYDWLEHDHDVATGTIEIKAFEPDDKGIWERIDSQYDGTEQECQDDYEL